MERSWRSQLAQDTILRKPIKGIPQWMLHIMEHAHIERLAGVGPGEYKKNPESVYLAMQQAIGTCMIDQYIPDNPLTMGDHGYENTQKGVTTGEKNIVVDGIVIDSPEAVVEHLERFIFPDIQRMILEYDEEKQFRQILDEEELIQQKFGPDILKCGYGFINFPKMSYDTYGYENYFMAYTLYPEIMEKKFSLQADIALLNNQAATRAYEEGNLPPFFRLDYDMADSRGTLVSIKSLDKLWFPHFTRCLEPLLKTNVNLIWHCDGNLMQMVPRLLDVGLKGFQGFQYEDGMDYETICRMKTKNGEDLIIIAGVSVTRTLPMGTPADVKKEIDWLVEYGPKTGLFLGGSSSIAPGVPWENIQTLVEGIQYYQTHGRK